MSRARLLILVGAGLSIVLAGVDAIKGSEGRLIEWPGDIHPIRLPHLIVVAVAAVIILSIARWTLRSDRRCQIVAIVLGILSVVTSAVFYLGSAAVMGTAAVGFGLEARERSGVVLGTAAILLGAAGALFQTIVNALG